MRHVPPDSRVLQWFRDLKLEPGDVIVVRSDAQKELVERAIGRMGMSGARVEIEPLPEGSDA